MSKIETNTIDTVSGTTELTVGGTNATDVTLGSGVKITNLESTGIDDNATSTAITIDSSENVTLSNDLVVPDKIVHDGDTNTAIRFPAADTITMETNGTETVRVGSSTFGVGNGTLTNNQDGFCNVIGTSGTKTQYYILQESQVEAHIGFLANNNQRLYINTGPTLGSTGVYMTNGGTSWTSNSDERAKTIIENITGGLNKVDSLRAVIGRYTDTDASDKRRPFLIAQDVQSVLPEAVDSADPSDLGLDYAGVIPLLVSALKDAKAQIDDLKTRVQTLEDA